MTQEYIYHVDGDLVAASEATVSVRDRGFMYGDAAFETLRAYGGEVFAWDAHVERLERTVETLGFEAAVPDREDLRSRIDETLSANDLADAYVKLSVTRGVQPGKLTPDPAVDPTVAVVVADLPRGGIDGRAVWDDPATVRTVGARRIPDEAVPADIKTHNYLNGILARLELGADPGASGGVPDEAIMADVDGYLAEGATSNLFFVDSGVLRTPTAEQSILPGVTRSIALELARSEGLPVEEGRYDREALLAADEAFLTNTTWEIRPIESVDGTTIGGGPMTDLLSHRYDRRVERECYRGTADGT